MGSWFVVNLGDAMLADVALQRIKTLFEAEYSDASYSNDLALFVRHESDGGLQCEVKVYFPPRAADLAQKLEAVICAKPLVHSLGLLVGSQQARAFWFPEA